MYCNNKLANCTNKLYQQTVPTNCTNKPKTTWSVIKTITNNKKNPNDILMMEIDGKITAHQLQHTTKPFQKNLQIITSLLLTTLLIIIL
jgi:hypothetical protein